MSDINDCSYDKNPENVYLSVKEELKINTLCEFVVCFGIHYNLEENVGFPIEKLSKHGIFIKKDRQSIDSCIRNSRLFKCLSALNIIRLNKRDHVNLISIFYKKYLQDIITGLMQLCYSSNSTSKDEFLNKWLHEDLFKEVDLSTLIRSFIMTQGLTRFNAPKWLTDNIGILLTNALMRPNSVLNVIKAVLEEINGFTTDWKKCDAVAQILVQRPKNVSIRKYVEFISPQLIDILNIVDPKIRVQLVRVAGSVYSLFAQKLPDLTKEILTKLIIEPFRIDDQLDFSINSKTLNKTLKLIHLVFVSSTEPNWNTLKQLSVPFIHLNFQIYNFTHKKTTCKNIHRLNEDLLKLYLNMKQNEIAKFLFEMLQCGILTNCSYCEKYNCILFEDPLATDSVCVSIEKALEDNEILISHVENKCNSLTDLILMLKDPQISIDYIFLLFEKLLKKVEESNTNIERNQILLDIENKATKIEKNINEKILVLTQLSNLFEKIDPKIIFDNHTRIIEFCRVVLESFFNNDDDLLTSESCEDHSETIYLIITILTLITCEPNLVTYEIKKNLQIFHPLLKKIKDIYAGSEMETFSDMLFMNIASFGVIEIEKPNVKKKVLIEEIGEDEDWCQIQKEIKDPMLPIRGHGLILLKKYLNNQQKSISNEKMNEIYDLLMKNLQSDDSYIYLASINSLIAFTNRDTNKGIETLLREFSNKKLDEICRVKIGEVIVKFTKDLGDLVPKYGNILLGVFLNGTKSENDLIRSSSLSNLGETCKMLKYSLSDYLAEIISCITSVLDTDKSIIVKRSAILTLKLLFEGLDKDFMFVTGNELKNLYRILKKVITIEQDDVLKLQAQLAYEYLDKLMRDFMFPKQTLEKTIKIL